MSARIPIIQNSAFAGAGPRFGVPRDVGETFDFLPVDGGCAVFQDSLGESNFVILTASV